MTVDAAGARDGASAQARARRIRVIFVCTGNSARSQMAEALLRHDAGDRFDPAEVDGTDAQRRAAFDRTLKEISGRLHAFIPLATAKARA